MNSAGNGSSMQYWQLPSGIALFKGPFYDPISAVRYMHIHNIYEGLEYDSDLNFLQSEKTGFSFIQSA